MMQAAEPRHGDNLALVAGCSRSRNAPGWRCLRQGEVGSVFVVVPNVFTHQAHQVAFIEHDHMVEQIAAATPDPALCYPILPRTPKTGLLGLGAEALHRLDHFAIETGAAVKDQIARRRIVGKGFPQLLDHPGSLWMLGNMEMQNAPPVVRNDKEAIQHAEGQRRHGEEIHGSNRFAVVGEERRPAFGWIRTPRRFSHPPKYTTLGNVVAEHFQFAMDAVLVARTG